MAESEADRIAFLRKCNETQPEGIDSYGFPVGQFSRELALLVKTNAEVYAAARGKKRGK